MTLIERISGPEFSCTDTETNDLISIDEALRRIVEQVVPVRETETTELAQALGRALAVPIFSRNDAPRFDNAAMDGYALNTRCLHGNGPWTMDVVAHVAAGQSADRVPAGKAVRILTGAPVPPGADTVIAQEEVVRAGDVITFDARPLPGQHVRKLGADMQRGAEVLPSGGRMDPRQIAACAAAGHAEVKVRRRPRVALLTTGDEVCPVGHDPRPGQIWDVNAPMLAAAISESLGCAPIMKHAADDPARLASTFAKLSRTADLIITTGGVSVGDADYLRPVFEMLGGRIAFAGVALKPGKPVVFGRLNDALWLGLPGNPLSAFVTWTIFGRPILSALTGQASPVAHRRMARNGADISHRPGRTELRIARLARCNITGHETVICDRATHSGRVGSLSSADGLVVIGTDVTAIRAGELVEFIAL